MGPGKALAIFKNTSLAYEGQAGSTLPKMAPQAKWKAGSEVEVGWWILAQHGGGYSYRLAPADKPLTEAEFQKMPLGTASALLHLDVFSSLQVVCVTPVM